MTIASAPGQVFLFGEHAVLYGRPALAAAIDMRIRVKGELRSDERLTISSKDVGKLSAKIRKDGSRWTIDVRNGEEEKLTYVTKAVELTFQHIGRWDGLDLRIDSDLPISSGLGSSSAVSIATIAATSNVLGKDLRMEEISELAQYVEVFIQGAASKAGVEAAARGGFVEIIKNRVKSVDDLPRMSIVVGNTGIPGSTAELIERVKKLKETRPQIFETIFDAIGKTTEVGLKALKKRNFRKVGTIMNANHMFLEALGVSSPELERLISAARGAGAIGAKLTGGGGGGSIIAIGSDLKGIIKRIEEKNGQAFTTKIGGGGLVVQ